MHWICPRARAGLSRLAASSEPGVLPAPTMVCSSSMKRIRSGFFLISARMAFTRSSNWPRYLVPATSEPISSEMIRLESSERGTSFAAMRRASPSTTADLPEPDSPISTGLFFLRRDRIWARRSISASRPTTGSRSPLTAARVRSNPYDSTSDFLPPPFPGAAADCAGPSSASSSAPSAADIIDCSITSRSFAGIWFNGMLLFSRAVVQAPCHDIRISAISRAGVGSPCIRRQAIRMSCELLLREMEPRWPNGIGTGAAILSSISFFTFFRSMPRPSRIFTASDSR